MVSILNLVSRFSFTIDHRNLSWEQEKCSEWPGACLYTIKFNLTQYIFVVFNIFKVILDAEQATNE